MVARWFLIESSRGARGPWCWHPEPLRRAAPCITNKGKRRHPLAAGTLLAMDDKKKMSNITNIWRLALAILGVIAIVQELRKPSNERTWHGKVADFVPYDFRMPSIGRVRNTYWNPEGSILTGKVFGVGWAPNLGALTRMAGNLRPKKDSAPQPS